MNVFKSQRRKNRACQRPCRLWLRVEFYLAPRESAAAMPLFLRTACVHGFCGYGLNLPMMQGSVHLARKLRSPNLRIGKLIQTHHRIQIIPINNFRAERFYSCSMEAKVLVPQDVGSPASIQIADIYLCCWCRSPQAGLAQGARPRQGINVSCRIKGLCRGKLGVWTIPHLRVRKPSKSLKWPAGTHANG